MSLLLVIIYFYLTYIVNTQCLTGSATVLPRYEVKRESLQSSTPFVFLFNKAKRKFSDSLDLIDLPEAESKKTDFLLSNEESTEEIPHIIVKIKTSEKSKTLPDECVINMTDYISDAEGRLGSKHRAGQISSREASKKPSQERHQVRVLNLTKNMFDYNAQKIYNTVNGIRLRLNKEHYQRIVLQTVQKQVENGLRELKVIKEKCDKDYVILSEQRKVALDKLFGLREVMKQKKELDENLSKLLDNAVSLNSDEESP